MDCTSRPSRKRSHSGLSSSSGSRVRDPSDLITDHAGTLREWQRAAIAWKVSYDQKVAQCLLLNQPPIGPVELYSDSVKDPPEQRRRPNQSQTLTELRCSHQSDSLEKKSDTRALCSSRLTDSPQCSSSKKPSPILLVPDTPEDASLFISHLDKTCNADDGRISAPRSFVSLQVLESPTKLQSKKSASESMLLAPETPVTHNVMLPQLTKPPSPHNNNIFAPKIKQTILPDIVDLSEGVTRIGEIQHPGGQLKTSPVASNSHGLPQISNPAIASGSTEIEHSERAHRPPKSKQIKQIETLSAYDALNLKERSTRFPTVQIWAEFLSQAIKVSSSTKIKDFMRRCRIYYLINPKIQKKLDDADRMRMRRLAEVGAYIEAELKPKHVTHLIVRDHTPWNSCLQAIKSVVHDPVKRQKIKEMCLSSSDKTPGEELIWVMDFKWVESCLMHQAIPAEKYMRILPRASKNMLPQKPIVSMSSEAQNVSQSVGSEHSQSSCDEIETSLSFNSGKYQMARSCKENETIIPGLERQLQLARLGEGTEEADGSDDEEILEIVSSRSCLEGVIPATAQKSKNSNRNRSEQSGSGAIKRNGSNEDICQKLEKIIELYGNNPNDLFRIYAIRKAVNILRTQSKRVNDFDTISKLKGIGTKTAQKIIEIANTSTHRRLQLVTEQDTCQRLFKGIYGVNETSALKWYQKGLCTLDDVRDRKGGISLSTSQELGLRFYEDLQQRIPREEVKLIFEQIIQAAQEVDSSLKLFPMGSYRRGEESCGDINVIVTRDDSDGGSYHDSMRKLYNLLKQKGFITYELSSTKKVEKNNLAFVCLCALNRPRFGKQRRIDLLGVPYDQLGAALIYLTGNEIFNRSMRLKARHLGYTLNQKGLFKSPTPTLHSKFDDLINRSSSKDFGKSVKTLVASKTEEEIFNILGVPFLKPEDRNV